MVNRKKKMDASTVENRLNPSVLGPVEDPTTDSMFNMADRQTKELLGQEDRSQPQSESDPQKKTAKRRKAA